MSRNMEVSIMDPDGLERASHKVSFGSKLLVSDGATVERGQKLFEWDPYTLPIISETDGYARFIDLTPGVSLREDIDEATGISQRIVSDWRSAPRGSDLKCWGWDNQGALGDGGANTDTNAPSSTAINLGTGRTALQVVTGSQHTCAILDNGDMKCWGDDTYTVGRWRASILQR